MKLSRAAHHGLKHSYSGSQAETATLIKTGTLTVHGLQLENPNGTAEVFLQFFDAAAAADVTVGTTAPIWSIMVPTLDGILIPPQELPLRDFMLGLVVAATATRTGSGAPAVENPAISIWYAVQ